MVAKKLKAASARPFHLKLGAFTQAIAEPLTPLTFYQIHKVLWNRLLAVEHLVQNGVQLFP